jgi:hypothetical protein
MIKKKNYSTTLGMIRTTALVNIRWSLLYTKYRAFPITTPHCTVRKVKLHYHFMTFQILCSPKTSGGFSSHISLYTLRRITTRIFTFFSFPCVPKIAKSDYKLHRGCMYIRLPVRMELRPHLANFHKFWFFPPRKHVEKIQVSLIYNSI